MKNKGGKTNQKVFLFVQKLFFVRTIFVKKKIFVPTKSYLYNCHCCKQRERERGKEREREGGLICTCIPFIIPPANEVAGVYSDPYVRPFVRSSARSIVRPFLPISNPLLL